MGACRILQMSDNDRFEGSKNRRNGIERSGKKSEDDEKKRETFLVYWVLKSTIVGRKMSIILVSIVRAQVFAHIPVELAGQVCLFVFYTRASAITLSLAIYKEREIAMT